MCHPSKKGSAIKGKNLLPKRKEFAPKVEGGEAISFFFFLFFLFLFRVDPFSEGIGVHES